MTETTTAPLTVRFPRLARRGLILGLSAVQVASIFVGLAFWILAVFTTGAVGLIVATPISGALIVGAVVRVGGHPGVVWGARWLSRERRRSKAQTRWRARPTKPTPEGSLGLPGTAASLAVFTSPDGPAMVYDAHGGTLTAVVRVTAPAFVLLDTSEQTRRVDGWARALAGLCQGGRIARVQVLERTIPDTGDGLARWWRDHGTDPTSWPSRVYAELITGSGPAAERHETYVALSLGLRTASRQIRQAGGGLGGATKVLGDEMRGFGRGLHSAGVQVHEWLGVRALAGVIRGAFDPAAIPVMDRRASIDPEAAGVRPDAAGPVAVDESWDRIRTDSGFHATYWISEWPRVEARASFLHPLLYVPSVRRSLSIVAEPVPIRKALRDVQRDKVEHMVDTAQRQRLGQLETESQRQEHDDVIRREKELVAGHGDMRFAGLLAVTAETAEALEEACGAVETAATQALVDVRRLVGEQAEAFIAAALPLGRGLR